jgi:hypothetical protein
LQKTSLKKKSKWTKVSLEKAVGAGVMPRGKTQVALRPPYGQGFYTEENLAESSGLGSRLVLLYSGKTGFQGRSF